MTRRMMFGSSAAVALALAFTATAQQQQPETEEEVKKLEVGSEAPEIDIEHWLKGKPVEEFEDDHVYVVEFWATWCGPCKASMPHISKLQERYKDYNVRFIGVSDESLDTVKNFLAQEEWDAKTKYTITTDPDKSVFNDYMKAAGQNGIPTAFIVGKDQKIEWIGHPMRIDSVIEKVVRDEWDREAYKVQVVAQAQIAEAMRQLASAETAEEGLATIRKNVTVLWDDAMALNQLAWNLTTMPQIKIRDHDFAQKLAERAAELTNRESGMILDTLARVHYEKGELEKAVEIQREAVEHAEENVADQVKAALEKYEKELKDRDGE